MSKTKEELQQEYTQACAELGNLEYQNYAMCAQIRQNDKQIEKVKRRMRKLSMEASGLPSEQAEAELAKEEANEAY